MMALIKAIRAPIMPLVFWIILILGLWLGLSLASALSWPPWGPDRLERAEQAAELGRAERRARQLEARGQVDSSERLAQSQARLRQLDHVTTSIIQEAQRVEDGTTTLDKDRLDRLRTHDRELCRQAHPLAGCPAEAFAPLAGDDSLRPASDTH